MEIKQFLKNNCLFELKIITENNANEQIKASDSEKHEKRKQWSEAAYKLLDDFQLFVLEKGEQKP